MNVLQIDEFDIKEIHESENYYKFVVKSSLEVPYFCSECMAWASDEGVTFKLHDTRKRTVADVDLRGKKVVIEVLQRRFNCSFCGKRFPEFFTSVSRNDKVTNRLWKQMGKEAVSIKNTFTSVAEQYGISVMTVKRAFSEYVAELDRKRVLVAPKVLGIDEVYIHLEGDQRKQPCAVFTDVENHQIIEFVVGNTKELVTKVIKSMQGYENIQTVAMDMNSGYRYAVETTIPKAYCVVDRFHVIQKANMKLDDMRSKIQNGLKEGEKKALFKVKDLIRSNREKLDDEAIIKLDAELEKYPRLHTAYWLKENLRLVYHNTTKYDAYQAYWKWEQSIPKDAKEMKEIQRMINRLKNEIFAFFDGRWTNGFTESFNNIIKRAVRLGNGYSYEVLRAKVLFGTEATVVTKVKDERFVRLEYLMNNPNDNVIVVESDHTDDGAYKPSYRVDINRLSAVLDREEY